MRNMVHLHLHTDASFLDGMILPEKLVKKAKEFEMPAVAITDHGSMSNTVRFYKAATKAGVKPIIGCELYVEEDKGMSHMVALVKNEKGYRNLNRLLFMAYRDNFYYKPRIKKSWLRNYGEGLVVTSACMGGIVPRAIERGEEIQTIHFLKDIFGDDFYLEVQANKLRKQRELNKVLHRLSIDHNVPLVGTIDAHFLNRSDIEAHKTLLQIPGIKIKASYEEAYFKSFQEMAKELPESCLTRTLEIADKCNFELDTSLKMPVFSEDEARELSEVLDAEFLNRTPGTDGYRERLEYEKKIIIDMGFSGYFLVLRDVVQWARDNGIPVGPGRGSAAGSLVSHILGITDLDPIKYGLLFERFLNPDRVSLPDIDIDFSQDKRQQVISYVEEKYGHEYVAKIMAFSKLKPRSAFKDVARVSGIEFGEANRISDTIPQESKTMKEAAELSSDFQSFYESNPRIIQICEKLIGVSRQSTVHAAGLVISPVPILDVVPMKYDKEAGQVISVDKDDVEYVGLVKMDFLGLETLTVIDKTGIDVSDIDLNDPSIIRVFSEGDTDGVFQFESDGMKQTLMNMPATSFDDLVAANALYRPGPLENGMIEEYIRNKARPNDIEYEFPELEPILSPTYAVLCYQEQVMQAAIALGGISRGDADTLRKAIGKKKEDLMEKIISKIINTAVDHGRDRKDMEAFFEKVKKFARYSFNKSHSTAYAKIAVQTAFLKKKYPAKFFAAAISVDAKNPEKVYRHIMGARRYGIDVIPPDLNTAERDAVPIGEDAVMLGFANVKGVGESAVNSILGNRPFYSITDILVRASNVNTTNLKKLIEIGALDSFGYRREDMCLCVDETVKRMKRISKKSIINMMIPQESSVIDHVERSLETWSKRDIMKKERSTLGFYLSGSPIDEVEKDLAKFDHDELWQIQSMRITRTRKKKEEMAIVDLTNYIRTVSKPIFPSMWENVKGKIAEGDVVMTKYDDDGYIVSILPAEGDVKVTGARIQISEKESVDKVYEILKKYPGDVLPLITGPGGDELYSDITIKYSKKLSKELEQISGVSVRFVI
ncbi:MAG: DNA polymerase III subunit alpha [Halobacteriota archaeon]|nr:DNA polymerase III subunit alpha [Halobacteriota archaeon]